MSINNFDKMNYSFLTVVVKAYFHWSKQIITIASHVKIKNLVMV